jgi:hypothetical protein
MGLDWNLFGFCKVALEFGKWLEFFWMGFYLANYTYI